MSDVERNIDVFRRLEAAHQARDNDTIRSLLTEDFTPHTAGSEMMPAGADGAIAANEGSYSFMPDKRTEILDLFGGGDRTVAHVRMQGTNTGEAIAWAGLSEPTGKVVDFDWIQISRHAEDGRIAETWSQMDVPKMLMQLGAMPAPGGM
jgi:predicted ester cyclase